MWKLCYRKDRAMRPISGCPENLRGSLTTPTATIPKIVHGLLFRSTLWMFLQNLKSVALPVSEKIWGTQKFWQPLDTPTLPFLQIFLWSVIHIGPVNVLAKFEVRSITLFWDNRGYPKNLDSPWYAHAPFSPKFLRGYYSEWPCKYIPKFEVRSYTCSWDKRG